MLAYALTIGLGAFLLFLVQPMIGKFILPWFGGGPGVWTTCLLFFQVWLLVGYAYAHGVSRWLSPRRQLWVHLLLLIGALALLPIIPGASWKPVGAASPVPRILELLVVCLGLPYMALAATGPLLQAWSARTHPDRSPYRLYALSNGASVLALISYPTVVEPMLTRRAQAIAWAAGFVVFAAACAYCAIRAAKDVAVFAVAPAVRQKLPTSKVARKSRRVESASADRPASTPFDRLMWMLLPACGSVLLLSVTSTLSEDIAPVPVFWLATLALYLATFIVCFEWPRLYVRVVFVPAFVLALGFVSLALRQPFAPIVWQASIYLFLLFVGAMLCQGELYRRRPGHGQLTMFYLLMSLGGALGAAFVSILAPVIFSDKRELYVGMFGAIGLVMLSVFNDPSSPYYRGARRWRWGALAGLILAAGVLMASAVRYVEADTVLWTRNFYSALRVAVRTPEGGRDQYRTLEHGVVSHGAQILSERGRRLPTMYYGPDTGVGLVMRLYPKTSGRRVGTVGLGVGTLAAYGRPGDTYRFYELDPQVERLARSQFTYLGDSAAKVDVILGDARLSLEREPAQQLDILVLDAFNGDAIPMHLLTREAFAEYNRHLVPNGVIAVHVSNRYLELHPVVHRLAAEFGFTTMFVDTAMDGRILENPANWVIATRDQQWLARPEWARVGFVPQGLPRVALWTDDHDSLFEVLRWMAPGAR